MTNEAREARNKYYREWRRKNPDKVKATAARHWAKVAAREAAGETATAGQETLTADDTRGVKNRGTERNQSTVFV